MLTTSILDMQNQPNASVGYVVQKSIFKYVGLLMRSQQSLPPDETIYHAINEPLGIAKTHKLYVRIFRDILKCVIACGLIAYKIATASPLDEYVNELLQKLREFGLKQVNERWIVEFIKSMNPPLHYAVQGAKPLCLGQLYGSFQLYLIGMGLACLIFAMEQCRAWVF